MMSALVVILLTIVWILVGAGCMIYMMLSKIGKPVAYKRYPPRGLHPRNLWVYVVCGPAMLVVEVLKRATK
jgi:hypothetical protein